LLPRIAVVLGWIYLTNDRMVSVIGRYLRDEAAGRLAVLADEDGVLTWEHDHQGDRRRRSALMVTTTSVGVSRR
jgi:hypothetical protein